MPNIAKQFYPEIQGIRALSILAVILFHFGLQALPGGYLGVDMFFVISGFLITKMISGELGKGTFSITRFYKNRVIRLLPNLFLMIVASVVISYLVLKPYDFLQYAKSLQFSAIYVTNMVFARQQGYFDMSRDTKTLLHTWSLSIEEQFYLFFPLLLVGLYRFKSHRITLLLVLAALSLWVRFDYIQQFRPTEGFFSFAGRAWEFVVGALAALLPIALRQRMAGSETLSLIGLLGIVSSLVLLDEGVPYSGVLVVIPCLATALLIVASHGTRSGDWLSGKTLVFIGGLSYSLYLWHWPLMVWLHNADAGLGRTAEITLLLASTALVSYLAWRYVEEPFRQNRERYSAKTVGLFTLSFALFCASVGSYIYAERGMESRFPAWVEVKKNLDDFDFKAATGTRIKIPPCSISDDPQAMLRQCAFGEQDANERFLVLGDSHAYAWYPAFQAAAEAKHAQGVLASLPGCPPIFGISSFNGAQNICVEGFDRRIGALIATHAFSKVFLVAHWSLYSEGEPEKQPDHFISDASTRSHDATSSKRVLARHLLETIQRMNNAGIQVIIVQSVPILPKTIQSLPADFSTPLAQVQQQNRFMTDLLAQQSQAGLMTLDPLSALCDTQKCQARLGGDVMYVDNNHISPAGAARLVRSIASLL